MKSIVILIRPILTDVSDTWRVVMGDGDRKTVQKEIYGPIKKGEHRRIRRNNEIKDIGPVTR